MLSVNTIRNECASVTYQRGRELFLKKEVHDISFENEEEYLTIVNGQVKGSGRKWYDVQISVDEDDEIVDYECTCPAYSSYWGMCKHCVALALFYRSTQEKVNNSSAVKEKTKIMKKATSQSVKDMISSYAVRGKTHLLDGYYKQVELIPEFHYLGKDMNVEFKIGADRKYVLKNIAKMMECIEKQSAFSYGQKLQFTHDREAFTDEAWQWIEMLNNIFHTKFSYFSYSQFAFSSDFRSIHLGAYGIEKCFQMYMGREITIDQKVYQLKEEDPHLTLFITETENGGAVLQMDKMLAIYGNSRRYLVIDHVIYQCSQEMVKHIWPALIALNAVYAEGKFFMPNQELYLDQEDYQAFFGSVFPVLEKYMTVSAGKMDIDSYRPKEAQLQVYLELEEQSRNEITARAKAVYGDVSYDLFEKMQPEKEYRDMEKELSLAGELQKYFEFADEGSGYLGRCRSEEEVYSLLKEGIFKLNEMAEVFADERIRGMRLIKSPKISIGVSLTGGLLDFDIQSDEMSIEEMEDILGACKRKKKYFRLKNGDFISLEDNGLSMLSQLASGLQVKAKDMKNGRFSVPEYRAAYVSEVVKNAPEAADIKRDREFKRLVREMKSYSDSDFSIPEGLNADLRNYQKDGFRWLATLDAWGFGGILADDMGLGKTLQVIAFLQMKKERSLIICPASLVYNWENELARFAPELKRTIVTGNAEERKQKIQESSEGVLITSYDLLKKDIEWYKQKQFYCAVTDEAQYIKNAGTLAAKSVKQVLAKKRFALTGTPIENRLSDLWSIFDFVMPGYLYGYEKFRQELELPVTGKKDEEALKRLQMMISPFILRRKKKDVLKDLPDKLEEVVYTKMEEQQRKLYQAHVKRLQLELSGQSEEEYNQNKLKYLAELTKLRMICCAPSLCFEDYKGGSAKTEMCLELLENAIQGGHRILVFSQFTKMLDILAAELDKKEIRYLYLSGKNTKEQRREMVEAFSGGEIPVFLISLKAGGTGLNLTAADMVIHYDPWWNKAAKDQAADRTHRIGQKNTVTVMDLVVKDSIEEKIIEIQQRKSEMADEVMGGSSISQHKISKEELLALLSDKKE